MATFKEKCGDLQIKVNDWDHPPPHCHVVGVGTNIRVSLYTLEVLHPKSAKLPPRVRKFLVAHQRKLLEAWERVHLMFGREPE